MHVKNPVHLRAQALVDYLSTAGGRTAKKNWEVAADLTFTAHQLASARRHTLICRHLGGLVVPYRGIHGDLVLLDPSAASALQAFVDRANPLMIGVATQQQAVESIQSRVVTGVESAAKEALSRGDKDEAQALDFAATDIASTGTLHPATVARLRALGLVK